MRALLANRPSWATVVRGFVDKGLFALPAGFDLEDLLAEPGSPGPVHTLPVQGSQNAGSPFRTGRPSMPRILPEARPNSGHSPVVVKQLEHRASDLQLRIADAITAFAGSMMFVLHPYRGVRSVVLVFEKSPWPTLTLVVSLEAIFLSTFVMIGQNRQSAFQQAKADHDYAKEEAMLEENTALTADDSRADATGTRVGVGAGRPAPPNDRGAHASLEHDCERGDHDADHPVEPVVIARHDDDDRRDDRGARARSSASGWSTRRRWSHR